MGAQKEWVKASKAQKKLLSSLEHKIERYKVHNNGYYYRLLIGPLRGNEHAKLLCKKLIQSRQNCIIKKM
ncbi:MAG UNVERIFIED_CONTAM: SPOR domain-containing protein [Rickettsiaceae bacterium]|jgi:cell division protein FtsN